MPESFRIRGIFGLLFTRIERSALFCQQPAVVVAVEMWEPAFGAGFQARWDGQQSSAKIPLKVPPNVISTANSEFCPFRCECCRWRLHKTKMCVSRNPRRTNTFTDCRAEPIFDRQPDATRYQQTAMLNNGTVVVAGGYNGSNLARAELY